MKLGMSIMLYTSTILVPSYFSIYSTNMAAVRTCEVGENSVSFSVRLLNFCMVLGL